MIELTTIRSEIPSQAGPDRADAADDEVHLDAGLARPVQRRHAGRVDDRVELEVDPRRAPGLGMLDLAVDELEHPRAQRQRRDEQPPERPLARQAGQDVEQVRDVGAELRPARQEAEVDVEAGRLRVVVAGPDVDVAAQARPLAAHDEGGLRVGLEADQAVHDVGAGLLELARPDDVRLLVEAGLDLDQDDDLLAPLGGPDEVAHDRRVAARPVERHLDRQDLGVVRGLGDEALDARGEALVRVVDEEVAGPDRAEHVGRLVVVERHEPARHDRRPARRLQVLPIEVRELGDAGEVEHPADLVAVVLREADAAQEDVPGRGRHRALDLEADGLAEAAPAKLLLDGEQEVVRLVLLDRQVGVAGDPEEVRLEDLHAAEQEVQVGLDDLVEQDERRRSDLDEAGQDLGHLDPGEPALAGLRVAHADRDREAERADVRERVAGVDREGRQDREDLVDEPLAQPLVVIGHLAVVEDRDAFFGKLGPERGEDRPRGRRSAPGPGPGSRPAARPGCGRPARSWSSPRRPAGATRRRGPGRTRRACWRRWPGT